MPAPAARAPLVVVMGVSGCGKSTLGQALAARLGVPFLEGDGLHPPANVQKMAAGQALDDDDRRDWLATLGARLAEAQRGGAGLVATCSALKRRYRDPLRAAAPSVRFVYLGGAPALIAPRLAARQGHYMPASLLASQFEALEPPAPDEAAITLDAAQAVEVLVEAACARLRDTAGQAQARA
jgi:gluconokinase